MGKSVWMLGIMSLAFAWMMSGPALALGYDNEFISDRNYLWNPFVGQSPWHGPYVYKTYPVPHAVKYSHRDGQAVAVPRVLLHHVRGAHIDRDLLWNPLMGYAPWLDGPNVLPGND